MKKAKRFLTGLLSAALALSLCAMPAMADEGGAAAPKVATTPDWNRTGSITINKYEYNGTSDSRDDGEGKNPVPEGAKPLDGVEFTIYQVQNAEWLKQYYQYTGTDSVKPIKLQRAK